VIFSLIAGAIGYCIALIDNSGILERDVIATQYCYIRDETNDSIDNVWLVYNRSNIETTKQYYCDKSNDLFDLESSKKRFIPAGLLVEVLFYSPDSTYARIKIEYEISYTPFEIKDKGYVPVCTLHDSLPSIIE